VSSPAPVARIGAIERRYLSGTFAELCRIESPSLKERACAERVTAELRAIGIETHEDDAGEKIGADCGNLLARIPASRPRRGSLMLCAHLDTVPLAAPVDPVLLDGGWENANEAILGADNKAAVAVLLALARHVVSIGCDLDLELLFTVGEEIALAGANEFDASVLQSDYGYVFDHASPIGEVIMDSPCHYRLKADFHGVAAHAGIRPEDGRSAILAAAKALASLRHGRIDGEGTVNIGTISGGSAINVVAERCSVTAEVRGVDDEHGEALVQEIVERIHRAANLPECDCDVDVDVQRTFAGYRQPPSHPSIRAAEAALRRCGHEPVRVSSGGGSDANALIVKGFQTVNLANGTERNHEPGERVSVQALDEMLEVVIALLDEVAALAAPAGL
jgi:tripeptide aminopeptidase